MENGNHEFSNDIEINVPYDKDLNNQSNSSSYVYDNQFNVYNTTSNPDYNYVSLPTFNNGHDIIPYGSLDKTVSLKIFCDGQFRIFNFNQNSFLYPRDVCNIYYNSIKKFYFKVWLRKNESNFFQLKYIPLKNETPIKLEHDSELVLSIKNFVTIDFFQCSSESLFNEISKILTDNDFQYYKTSSREFYENGFYNTPRRIFVKNFFLNRQNGDTLTCGNTIDAYFRYYSQPTISIVIYKSEIERILLINWIKMIPNNATIFKLVHINSDFKNLNNKILSIIKYLF